jgi:predicted GNAT family acetyltransferase
MTASIRDNVERERFEMDVEGEVAFATYRRDGGTLVIRHVEAPPALRGKGVAGRLMAGIVDVARAEGLKIAPRCGYAALWIRRHREHHDLLA